MKKMRETVLMDRHNSFWNIAMVLLRQQYGGGIVVFVAKDIPSKVSTHTWRIMSEERTDDT